MQAIKHASSQALSPRFTRARAAALLVAALGAGAALAQDPAAGQRKASMCIGCHGIVGYQASFPQVYKVPMISGQGGKYIVAALNAYKKGERKHPTMRAIAQSLSDQDMAELAAFYSGNVGSESLKPVAETPSKAAPADVAAVLAKGACTSCHGANFNKPLDPSYPKLAGQYPDYLYATLKAYATDGNPKVGRANAVMSAQAKQLTHPQMKLLADYIATLPGDVKTVPEPRFR